MTFQATALAKEREAISKDDGVTEDTGGEGDVKVFSIAKSPK